MFETDLMKWTLYEWNFLNRFLRTLVVYSKDKDKITKG